MLRKFFNIVFSIAVCLMIAACGGGGGSPGTNPNAGSGSGTGGGTTNSPTVVVSLVNASNASANSITVGGGYQVQAVVKDGSGAVVANKLVTFSVNDSAIAVLTQTTALTDASGVALVPIAPASVSAVGAAAVTATATFTTSGTDTTVAGKKEFAVQAAALTLSPISLGSSSLAAGGVTTIATTAYLNGVPASGTSINVTYTASCGRVNGVDASAGGVSVATNGSGIASAVYTAVDGANSLCSGGVNLTASSAGAAQKTAAISVAAPVANAITFVSAAPAQIYVAGAGAIEQSIATFKVFAAAGSALAGANVQFSIQTNPGGVGLNAAGATGPVSGTTDANGQVSVSVYSGTIPGPVKVRAALVGNPAIFAETQDLTVASGPPSQRYMSLSAQKHSLEGWVTDGTSTVLTVRIADRQGNAVPDGTVVNFTAEGGQVARACTTTTTEKISSCSVTFVTQNPRPTDGRVSVLAYLAGTKDYVDNNQNNIFDTGDTLSDLGDAYRDDNENNVFDDVGSGEFVVPRGGSIPCTGTGGAFPSRADTCDGGLATTVRQAAVLLFASSEPVLKSLSSSASSIRFNLASKDHPLLPMPAGTSISATPIAEGCTVADIGGSPVVNVAPRVGFPGEDLATAAAISLRGCAAGQTVNVKVTAPSGLVTTFAVPLN